MEFLNLFGIVDIAILIFTLLTPVVVGIYYGVVNKKTTEELLVGGRKMKIFPVAASIMATMVSAVTILGLPAEVYNYGIQIFQLNFMSCIFIPICVYLLVPFFYSMKLTSINEYLELRFNSVAVRMFGGFVFIFQQMVLAGVSLYAPSIALESFLGFSSAATILGLGIAGTIYTSVGGFKAVVWTDTFQLILMYIGLVVILTKSVTVAGGISRTIELATEGGRLNLFDFTVDPFMRHNFLNFVIGFGIVYLAQPGVRQHEVQRYSSLPTVEAAKRSMLLSIPIKMVSHIFCVCTGVAIYAVYAGCDPISAGQVKKADELIPLFVIKELSDIPGMVGLFTSCLFCAVLSSYSSQLNGTVAVTWKDFLFKLRVCQEMSEKNRTILSMVVGLIYGSIIVTFAFFAKHMGGVFQASYAVTGPPSGVFFGVFFMALFLPFTNKQGALGGMILGLSLTTFISLQAFARKTIHPKLPMSTNQCDSVGNVTAPFLNSTNSFDADIEIEWPEKMYKLSYVLYPAFSAVVTLVSGILISLIVRAFSKEKIVVDEKYLHPFLQKGRKNEDPGFEMSARS